MPERHHQRYPAESEYGTSAKVAQLVTGARRRRFLRRQSKTKGSLQSSTFGYHHDNHHDNHHDKEQNVLKILALA